MSAFTEDNGQVSMMRIQTILITLAGIAILVYSIYTAYSKGQNDIGQNIMVVCMSMIGGALAGKIIQKKIENDKAKTDDNTTDNSNT